VGRGGGLAECVIRRRRWRLEAVQSERRRCETAIVSDSLECLLLTFGVISLTLLSFFITEHAWWFLVGGSSVAVAQFLRWFLDSCRFSLLWRIQQFVLARNTVCNGAAQAGMAVKYH
jgi:hypothetical protein